jgi:hypothetical protein
LDDVGHSRQARSLPVHYRSKARRNVKELKNSSKSPPKASFSYRPRIRLVNR